MINTREFIPETRYNESMVLFRGYVTHSLKEAASLYKTKTGTEPTILLVRPEYDVLDEHPALVRSRLAAWGMVCASHLLSCDEMQHLKLNAVQTLVPDRGEHGIYQTDLRAADLQANSSAIYKAPVGRPKAGGGSQCPHCRQDITNFDNLGWWWGWHEGIEPPYWEELRIYVFKRDKFSCQVCHKQFSMNGLQCHHITPKETGGADGARNLITLCKEHHLDTKLMLWAAWLSTRQ